jgi:uncharacterized protein
VGERVLAEQESSLGPATVLIGHRVKAGLDAEYRRWQDQLNVAATGFPGYLGTQVGVGSDERGESAVVYRFGTAGQLNDWLDSPVRRRLVELGAALFEGPPTQRVMVGGGEEAPVATAVVVHPVRPGDEPAFLDWYERMTEAERGFPGFLGSELFRPVAGAQRDWTVVYRYARADDLDRWLASDVRTELLRQGERFQDFDLRTIVNTFGSWFSFADRDGAPGTPPWKTALSVLVGLYPTVVLLTVGIGAIWPAAPLWASLLVGNVASVALLTWAVMPTVTRALRFWLTPAAGAARPRTDLVGVLVAVAFLVGCAAVFRLLTG